jgi:hypothetical protein
MASERSTRPQSGAKISLAVGKHTQCVAQHTANTNMGHTPLAVASHMDLYPLCRLAWQRARTGPAWRCTLPT